MERNIKTRLADYLKSSVIERKAMFIPIACVLTFMLVGYAAVDREAPTILSKHIILPYGETFTSELLDITDNKSKPELLVVDLDTDSLQTNQLGTYEVGVEVTDQFSNVARETITVEVVDKHGPKFEVLGINEGFVIQVPVKGSEKIESYVKAVDDVEGDVTPFITTDRPLNTKELGSQTITLTVSDMSGNTTKETYEFVVADSQPPKIELKNNEVVILNYGDAFDVDAVATITDNFDDSVKVNITGNVDMKLIDKQQTIVIEATDTTGNKATKEVQIKIKDTEKPTLSLTNSSVQITMGDSFNPKKYIQSANDNKDGNITDKVTYSSISTTSAGNKTVTYKVTDSSGNTTTKSLSVMVVDPNASIYGQSAVYYAKSKVGYPYVYGATGPYAFDCSGLTQWAFRQAGKSIPRTSVAQSQGGTYVPRNQLKEGDLVFFATMGGGVSHVGIYVGGGMMVHAGTESTGVIYSSISILPYVTARRY